MYRKKCIFIFLTYLLSFRIDAENFDIIKSYEDQIGAWWLGFPILSILLVIPGLLLSWFPRRLPSVVTNWHYIKLYDAKIKS